MPYFSDMKSRSLTSILSDDNNENNNKQQLLNGRLNNCKIDGSTKILNLNNLGVRPEEWLTAAPSIPTTATSIMHYANRQTKSHNKTNNYILWLLTPVAASFAVAIIIAALAGPQWLLTEEKVPNLRANNSMKTKVTEADLYITKNTKSSLWIICTNTSQVGTQQHCSKIDYFPTEEYEPDPNDSTNSIPYAITHSTPFFLISNVILLMSYTLLLTALCSKNHEIYYFISGVLFIIAGLLMLIGLIMYISIFKAEVGSKLRPKSSLQAPLFTFEYGKSFMLYVVGFILTEFTGILSVLLYTNMQGAIGLTAMSQNKDFLKFNKNTEVKQVVSSFTSQTIIFSPPGERRYYFKKDPDCHVHSKKFTKSLNELYTDPAPDVPFNYRITMPITRSVSTATEINDHPPTTPSANQNTKTKATSTLKELTNDMCGIRKNSSTSTQSQSPMEEKLFQEFCKKMGPRPKPKNIYYIDDEGGFQNDDDVFIIDNSNNQRCGRRKSIGHKDGDDDDDRIARVREKQQQQHLKRQPFSLPTNRSLCDLDKIYPDNYLNFKENSSNNINLWNKNTRNCNTLPRNFLKNNKLRLENDSNGKLTMLPDFDGSGHFKFTNKNQSSRPHHHQWPKCIPTTAMNQQHYSQYYSDYTLNHNNSAKTLFHIEDDLVMFDLDEIEREKRKSHASLFEATRHDSVFRQPARHVLYDTDSGTAV